MALQELRYNSFVFGICGDHVTAPKNRLAHIACSAAKCPSLYLEIVYTLLLEYYLILKVSGTLVSSKSQTNVRYLLNICYSDFLSFFLFRSTLPLTWLFI